MFEFEIVQKSKLSRARIGILKTAHGEVETPSLVAVATNAVVKTLTSDEVYATKTRIIIANTLHLHLRLGERILKRAGGIHKFMSINLPIMTDSGGFQVFSLGFGHDFKVGKILKYFPSQNRWRIDINDKPKFIKITNDGVFFRSLIDGKQLFFSPRQSIRLQEQIGADIIFSFDECTAPLSSKEYAKTALERTHQWARDCLLAKKSQQAIFGIVQGSRFKELRMKSAKYINSLPFDGFGIGGDLGLNKQQMNKILNWTIPYLDETKPRHLLGIGYLEDMEAIIKNGVDLFDCTVPTHYARHGVGFTSIGKLNFEKSSFLHDTNPLDPNCGCRVCQTYKRSYICHLLKAKEITALRLLTFHNLYYFNTFVEKIRKKIKRGFI